MSRMDALTSGFDFEDWLSKGDSIVEKLTECYEYLCNDDDMVADFGFEMISIVTPHFVSPLTHDAALLVFNHLVDRVSPREAVLGLQSSLLHSPETRLVCHVVSALCDVLPALSRRQKIDFLENSIVLITNGIHDYAVTFVFEKNLGDSVCSSEKECCDCCGHCSAGSESCNKLESLSVVSLRLVKCLESVIEDLSSSTTTGSGLGGLGLVNVTPMMKNLAVIMYLALMCSKNKESVFSSLSTSLKRILARGVVDCRRMLKIAFECSQYSLLRDDNESGDSIFDKKTTFHPIAWSSLCSVFISIIGEREQTKTETETETDIHLAEEWSSIGIVFPFLLIAMTGHSDVSQLMASSMLRSVEDMANKKASKLRASPLVYDLLLSMLQLSTTHPNSAARRCFFSCYNVVLSMVYSRFTKYCILISLLKSVGSRSLALMPSLIRNIRSILFVELSSSISQECRPLHRIEMSQRMSMIDSVIHSPFRFSESSALGNILYQKGGNDEEEFFFAFSCVTFDTLKQVFHSHVVEFLPDDAVVTSERIWSKIDLILPLISFILSVVSVKDPPLQIHLRLLSFWKDDLEDMLDSTVRQMLNVCKKIAIQSETNAKNPNEMDVNILNESDDIDEEGSFQVLPEFAAMQLDMARESCRAILMKWSKVLKTIEK